MIKELQWYNIAVRLRDFLKAFKYKNGKRPFDKMTDRENLKIRVGKGNTGEFPAIWIIFGSEEDANRQASVTGAVVQLWVDIYVTNQATSAYDMNDNNYKQMYDVETEFCDLLWKFNKDLQKRGLGVKLTLQGILSDGDENENMNVSQHRLVIDIEWYK